MEYKNIADIKKPVSRIVFGTAISAMMRGEHVHKLLDEVFAAGVNTFDLARNYGFAERLTWIPQRESSEKNGGENVWQGRFSGRCRQ